MDQERIKKAIKLHRSGKTYRAEAVYRKILKTNPLDTNALHYLGVLLHQQGKSRQAIKLISKALNLSPEYVDAYKNLGNVYLGTGELELAEKSYLEALRLQSADPQTLGNLCNLLIHQSRIDEAIEAGARCVHYAPEYANGWYQLGNAFALKRSLKRAIAAYEKALKINPLFFEAHSRLCSVLYQLELSGEMVEDVIGKRRAACRAWLETDPENKIARFMLAACDPSVTPERAPKEFISKHFDDFAASFDRKLSLLDYRVPELMAQEIQSLELEPGSARILDAGCGTGLCAGFLKAISKKLVGVDLSAGMLARARQLALYDQLHEAELTAWLKSDSYQFDLIICADTLCYFGDLHEIILSTAERMVSGGHFVFTVEHLVSQSPNELILNTSGRYAHTREHVSSSVKDAGLVELGCDDKVLRKELNNPVNGLLVLCAKY